MNKFLNKILIFLFSSLFTYFVIGLILETKIYENIKKNQFQIQEDWHIKHKDFNEILFIGNSRTWVQFDVQLITQKIKKKAYCLAQDGRDSRILFWKLKKYLEINRAPKQIFLQFDSYFIKSRNDKTFYGKNNYLGYLFNDRLGINEIFENEIGFNQLDVYLPLNRYFKIKGGLEILKYHLFNRKTEEHVSFKFGSLPQNRTWDSTSNWLIPEKTNGTLDFKYIDSILNICVRNNIEITLVYPPQSFPSYKQVDKNLITKLNEFSSKKKIRFWNFNHIKYNNKDLFYNHIHLNKSGSYIFTLDFIDSIYFSKSINTIQGSYKYD